MQATFADLTARKQNRTPAWLRGLFDFLVRHEDECHPYYWDISEGKLSWVMYHRAPDGAVPANFVAVRDAVMKLNYARGYGCTKAMIDAVTLDACLRDISLDSAGIPPSFSKMFFRKQAPRIQGLWSGDKQNDYGWSTTTPVAGETLEDGSFGRNLTAQMWKLCAKDPEAYHHMWHVMMMLVPPTDIFTPWFMFRLLKQWLFG